MFGGRKVWRKCCKCLFGEKSLANLQFTKKPYKERGYCLAKKVWRSIKFCQIRQTFLPPNFCPIRYMGTYAYTHRHKYMQTNWVFTRFHLSRF